MIQIILSSIGFIVVISLIVKYNRSKRKNKQATGQNLSSLERIINSLDTKIRKSLKNLADDTRTMEIVRDEINFAFDDAKNDLKESSADYIISLKKSQANILNNKVIYENNINDCINKARDYKKVYEDSKDENYLNMSKEFIINKLAYEEGLIESDKMLADIQKEYEMFEMNLYRIAMALDRKKLDILGNITKPVHSLNLNLNMIDTLYKEFNTIKDTVETKQKVEEIVEGRQFEDVSINTTNYTEEQINQELAKL